MIRTFIRLYAGCKKFLLAYTIYFIYLILHFLTDFVQGTDSSSVVRVQYISVFNLFSASFVIVPLFLLTVEQSVRALNSLLFLLRQKSRLFWWINIVKTACAESLFYTAAINFPVILLFAYKNITGIAAEYFFLPDLFLQTLYFTAVFLTAFIFANFLHPVGGFIISYAMIVWDYVNWLIDIGPMVFTSYVFPTSSDAALFLPPFRCWLMIGSITSALLFGGYLVAERANFLGGHKRV